MKQEQFIGCDAHKEYSVFVTLGPHGMDGQVKRVGHELESMRNFLSDLPSGTPIALEAGGTYYWLVQEMERTSTAAGAPAGVPAADGFEKENRCERRDGVSTDAARRIASGGLDPLAGAA